MKYKLSSKIVSLFLAVLLLMSLSVVSVSAYASGTGTESDPYCITSAQELQNVNDNPSASYKLAADIDLKDTDFVPLGNAESGAFSGTFDGNGFTISNLNVHAGKYAGLFGCNEGVIKNVTLDDIYIYGNRYLGGVCGHNTQYGTVENCTVLGGQVESDGGINDISAGGIIGQNDGEVAGKLDNNSNITVHYQEQNIYSGGIIGYNNAKLTISASNRGDVQTSGASGSLFESGIIAYTTNDVSIKNSLNTASISNNGFVLNRIYAGGLLAYATSDVEIYNSYNCGNISFYQSDGNNYQGGLAGYIVDTVNISNCYNTGILDTSDSGGIVGYAKYGTITTSFNSGSCWAGIICRGNTSVTNCYNSGYAYYGIAETADCVKNCYSSVARSTDKIFCYSAQYRVEEYENNYFLKDAGRFTGVSLLQGTGLSKKEMCDQNSFLYWDFDNIWTMGNSYPVLKEVKPNLYINSMDEQIGVGEVVKLGAYNSDNMEVKVTWTSSSDSVVIDDDGFARAVEEGTSIITAEDQLGNKANCVILVYTPCSSISLTDKILNVYSGMSGNSYNIIGSDTDFIIEWISDNEQIVQVDDSGQLMPVSVGTATITACSRGGAVGTQKITVVNTACSFTLPSSATVARGSKRQINATIKPNPTSSKITWTSSDENVATVDQNGVVTGVSVGQAVITATTDNGYSDTCTVTVNAPVTSMHFARPSVTIYKNDTDKLNLVTDPADTTDQITYSSSSTSRVTVSNDGTITAGASAGSATITATSSSGIKAYCSVTVIDQPVPVESVTLNKTNCILSVGDVFKLVDTVLPETATNKTVSWRSTDDSVASVNQDGTVTANGAGKAVITAEAENGAFAYCEVTVTGPGGANQSKIYVPDVVEADGDYVTVPVMLENNPGISFASLRVSYDSAVLEPLSISNGVVFDSVLGSIEADESEVKLCFTSEEDVYEDGVLAYVRFKVVGDLEEQTPITLCYFPNEIRNAASDLVAFKLEDGAVGAKELPDTFISGDVNDDGVLTSVDARYVLQYVTGARKFDENQLKAADMNGDGSITAVDARMILQMITQS